MSVIDEEWIALILTGKRREEREGALVERPGGVGSSSPLIAEGSLGR